MYLSNYNIIYLNLIKDEITNRFPDTVIKVIKNNLAHDNINNYPLKCNNRGCSQILGNDKLMKKHNFKCYLILSTKENFKSFFVCIIFALIIFWIVRNSNLIF